MINRIAKYCKTLKHYILLLTCSFLANTTLANSASINVYLKLKPKSPINQLIKEFNQFLKEDPLLTSYQVKPYLEQHPLHLTLYLANYNKKQIPLIIKQIHALSKQQKQISILTSRFSTNELAYVMLSVHHEDHINLLSNRILSLLTNLRDKNAFIPAWAAQDTGRQLIFKQYGSPSVLKYFNPHFSILEANHLNKKQRIHLHKKLLDLISKFAKSHPTQVYGIANAIGVGLTDEQGQIVKELKSFPLSSEY